MGLLGVGLIQVPAQDSQTDPFFGAPDWQSLGLILAVVGCFLLANSILFRDPRALVRAHFGKDREKLLTLREQLFQRVQLTLGFGYLLGGFALQLYGRLHPPSAGEVAFPVLWIGIVITILIVVGASVLIGKSLSGGSREPRSRAEKVQALKASGALKHRKSNQ